MNNNLISKARKLATEKHLGQFRKFSGEAYIEHPKRVAQTVLKYKDSEHLDELMAASLLHDVVEDTDYTISEIEQEFGELVASLVHELTSIENLKGYEKALYLSDKMENMTSWALVIKLADRYDNVSDLRHVNKSFRQKYIKETKAIISHLIASRELSLTHVELITDILKEITGVSKIDGLEGGTM